MTYSAHSPELLKFKKPGTCLVVQWLASPSNAVDASLISGWGAKISHASQPKKQNLKQKEYCNRFNKDVKNGPH